MQKLNIKRRWIGLILLMAGCLFMMPLAVHYTLYKWEQSKLDQAWNILQQHPADSSPSSPSDDVLPLPNKLEQPIVVPTAEIPPKSTPPIEIHYPVPIVGKLSIPRIGLDDIILDGTSLNILSYGPGHLLGSAYPGQPGNTVIAAHNDLEFHTLGSLKVGDPIYIKDSHNKVFTYKVEKINIIGSNDVLALNTTTPILTLSTCYPFNAYKDTPYRYVVQARMV
ncbi:MAG: class D sortase [Desulfitobacteriaceae bacterium]